jgi:Pectate lyase superfamily protein
LRESVSVKDFGAVGNGTADDTSAVNAAIATGKNVFFPEGTYKITAVVNLTQQGQALYGYGRRAELRFSPATALTNAINCTAFDLCFRDLWISANANVTNIIKVNGNGSRGRVDNCLIAGTTTSGQRGIYGDGTTPACFFWVVTGCDFVHLDEGIKLTSTGTANANAWFMDKLSFGDVNTGILLDNSLLNTTSNIFHQTQSVAAVRLTNSSQFNTLTNIIAESNTAPTLIFDSGCRFNTVYGATNSGSGPICADNGGASDVNYISTGQIGQYTPTPTVSTSAVTNRTGTRQSVVVSVGSTATNVVKNGVFLCTLTNSGVSVSVNPGESINVSQTTNVAWTWWRD